MVHIYSLGKVFPQSAEVVSVPSQGELKESCGIDVCLQEPGGKT